jgi:hypothetical protein
VLLIGTWNRDDLATESGNRGLLPRKDSPRRFAFLVRIQASDHKMYRRSYDSSIADRPTAL